MTNPNHYTYQVTWSSEDNEYIATVAEIPSLSWLGTTQNAAFQGIRQLVSDVIEDMHQSGENPPEPIAERKFSGKFQVRIPPPELHRQLALEAAEQNVSLNRLASKRLVGT